MKRIYIKKFLESRNFTALDSIIDEVEGKAFVRLISAEEVCNVLVGIENALGISKRSMVGVAVTVDINARHFPRSYRGCPQSTKFNASYTPSGWAIDDIYRGYTSSTTRAIEIHHTDASRQALMEKYTTMCIDDVM